MLRKMGAGTADPKANLLEDLRACPICNTAMSPTYQKNPTPAPFPGHVHWIGTTVENPLISMWIRNETMKKRGHGKGWGAKKMQAT